MDSIDTFKIRDHFSPFRIFENGTSLNGADESPEIGFIADPSLLVDGYSLERLVPSALTKRGFSVSKQIQQSVSGFLGPDLADSAERGVDKPRLWVLQPKLFTDTVAAGVLGHPSGSELNRFLLAPLQSIQSGLLSLVRPSQSSGTGFRSRVTPAFQSDFDDLIRFKSDSCGGDGDGLIDDELAALSGADGLAHLCGALEHAINEYADLLTDLFDDKVLRTLLGLWPVNSSIFEPKLFRRTSYSLDDIKNQGSIDVALLEALCDSAANRFDNGSYSDRDRVAVSVFLDSLVLAVTGELDVSKLIFVVNGDSVRIGESLADPSIWGFLSQLGVVDILLIAV